MKELKNKSDINKCRNKELMNLVQKYYLKGKLSQKETAKKAGITIGALKNFLYRYSLTKKESYTDRNEYIMKRVNDGAKIKEISQETSCSKQLIYKIIKNYDK